MKSTFYPYHNCLLSFILAFCFATFTSCDDGREASSSSDTPVAVTLNGSAVIPALATSASIAALAYEEDEEDASVLDDNGEFVYRPQNRFAVTGSHAAGCTVEVYTLEGAFVCETITGDSGIWSCGLENHDSLKPSTVTADTFSGQLITTITCGTRVIESYTEPSVDPASTTELAIPATNLLTTLALQNVVATAIDDGFAGWGIIDYSSTVANPKKAYDVQRALLANAQDAGDDTMKSRLASVMSLFEGFFAAEGNYDTLGYNTPYAFFQDFLKNTADTTKQEALSQIAATPLGQDAAVLASKFATAMTDYSAIKSVVATNFLKGRAVDLYTDISQINALAQSMVSMDKTRLTTAFGDPRAFEAMKGVIDKYSDLTTFNPTQVASTILTYSNNWNDYYDTNLGAFSSSFIDAMHAPTANGGMACTTIETCQQEAAKWEATYAERGFDYCSTATCYTDVKAYFDTVAVGDVFDATGLPVDGGSFGDQYQVCVESIIAQNLVDFSQCNGGWNQQPTPEPAPPAEVAQTIAPVSATCKDGDLGSDCVRGFGTGADVSSMVDGNVATSIHWNGPAYPIIMAFDLGSSRKVTTVNIIQELDNPGNQIKFGQVQFKDGEGVWRDFSNIPPYADEANAVSVLKPGGGSTQARFWRVINTENRDAAAGWYPAEFSFVILVPAP
ncbi:MAG: hypothetical protein A3G32_00055 [Deltaproteobacteria bacterium RIFCSPLOWO2_12_FULL_40_28]|nr:MAG: hypothetical protein A3C45_02850 [Deltaproteobacteria bacterium RIFCSPHIGHO2_02_FULL_40_28]OGQ20307.1 MAG: hypothetical protein A3E27_09435 [Deltaproteobacteria bacterium RIFCSPHIGHO2_12_FULL_40_32]OGQ40760.1 MAG: hypothetical protein A3I69_09450 [Deltaproteobacteria bacterium RIFCSPLOWO2_02_FULL_40_36]OGQ54907.1 MAG: hypothetical protein A3G32_00055 [Deltaproteobacteria bacterium RIFCSPLOWO2_12_FULL_40_28]